MRLPTKTVWIPVEIPRDEVFPLPAVVDESHQSSPAVIVITEYALRPYHKPGTQHYYSPYPGYYGHYHHYYPGTQYRPPTSSWQQGFGGAPGFGGVLFGR